MLTIYRRHRKACKQRSEGRTYRRCLCPIWVDGYLNGGEIRKSLKTRDWQAAHELVRRWEAEGNREERPIPGKHTKSFEQTRKKIRKERHFSSN